MVFGWKKKQTGSKNVEAPVLRDIALDEIRPTLENFLETRRKRIIRDFNSSLNGVKDKLDEMLKITMTLESQKLTEDETDKHINTIVERGMGQIITVIKKAANTKIKNVNSYDDAIVADRELHRILKVVGDVLGRQTRVIHIFAKKYAIRLKAILSELNVTRDEISKSLAEHTSFESSVLRLNEKIANLYTLYDIVKNSTSQISVIEDQIKAHKATCESANAKISQIKSTPEYNEYQKIIESVDRLDGQRRSLDHTIDESFAKISRPLSKYIYVTSLDKTKKATMSTILDRPAHALFTAGVAEITTILEHVRKAVSSGSVSVKSVTKSEEQIDAIISEITAFYSQISDLDKKKRDFESAMRSFDSSTLDSENTKLSNGHGSIESLELRIREIRADRDSAEIDIPVELKNIEVLLRAATSTQYTIISEHK